MNADVKTKWLAALRSGEYQQIDGSLHKDQQGFCCLGVLCDLYHKETGRGAWETDTQLCEGERRTYTFKENQDSNTSFLITTVQNWAFDPNSTILTGAGALKDGIKGEQGQLTTLAEINDAPDKFDFNRIADIIKQSF